MIRIEKVKEDYYACNSCLKNKRDDNEGVLKILIGHSENHMQSIRLCEPCLVEMNEQFLNQK